MKIRWVTAAMVPVLAAGVVAQTPVNEDVARRQLESGRSFARQGNYGEALKDFRSVADTHASTSVADDALLEIARYFLDVADDQKEAAAAVDRILTKYATSDSAADAFVIAGRLALRKGHTPTDIAAALAMFDRVERLFPRAEAVAGSLSMTGEAHWYAKRYDAAIANFGRVTAEYPSSAAAAEAYVGLGRTLVALGQAPLAMEELQQARNRWPASKSAATAIEYNTLLHRLYVRAKGGAPFALTTETAGPPKLQNVTGLAMRGKTVYWSAETGVGGAVTGALKLPQATKPRGLTVDVTGDLVAIEELALRPGNSPSLAFAVPGSGAPKPFEKIEAAVQLSNSDWVVADGDWRTPFRFKGAASAGAFGTGKLTRLAVNAVDEVAGIDREQKAVVVFDATGKPLAKLPLKGNGYDLPNPEDIAFDAFGHLYVLDRTGIAVFTPYPSTYTLLTFYAAPQSDATAFKRGTAFALDPSGGVYLYDERAQRIMVYR
jgi:tetratricopeptide (TPR) repeat protein